MAALSSSRSPCQQAPTALIWAPGFSHSPIKTGSLAWVTVQMISAPLTASSGVLQGMAFTPKASSAQRQHSSPR